MIALPRYQTMVDSFGRLVDEAGHDALYLVDTSFFEPPNPRTTRLEYGNVFKGNFFHLYQTLLLENKLTEPDDRCLALMDVIEEYHNKYLEFLRTAIDSGLEMQTITSVKHEIREMVRVNEGFNLGALKVPSGDDGSKKLIERKKYMAAAQQDYVRRIRREIFSIIEERDLVDTELMMVNDPVYRRIRNTLMANVYKWTGKESKGVDESLIALGFLRATEGRRVVILTEDKGFEKEVRGVYRDGHLSDLREQISSSGSMSVVYLTTKGVVTKAVDTRKLKQE